MGVLFLFDQKKPAEGLELTKSLVQAIQTINRRTLDSIAARLFFYFVRFHELADSISEVHGFLLSSYRTAVLRQDNDLQAVLLNSLLKYYLDSNLVDQADKLVSKATFPETAVNNQLARYLYYLGRIKAIQLDYSAAHAHLQQAIRKAPSNDSSAGFQQAVLLTDLGA